MINIFVGIAQNQVDIHQNLIKQLGKENEYNILVTSELITYDNEMFQKVISSGRSFNNNATTNIERLESIIYKTRHYKKIVKQLYDYKKVKDITLYFCYIEDILTNHLFFYFNKNIKAIVVEDGTLNYYNHTIKNISKLTFTLKTLIAYLYGVKIKKYKGHSSGVDYDKVECQYVRLPNSAISVKKSKQLEIEKVEVNNFSNSVLIIGQEPLEDHIGENEYYRQIVYLLTKIKELKGYNSLDKIYYKPHRNGKNINRELLNSIIKNIVFLDSNTPLENMYINELKSKYIFGFKSSAAINIYMRLTEESRRKLKFNMLLTKDDALKALFVKLNFNILHL